jgi:hypothetical protein
MNTITSSPKEKLTTILSAKEEIGEILKLTGKLQTQVAILLYRWWSERCGVREGELRSAASLAQLVRTYAEETSTLKRQEGSSTRKEK